MIILASMFVIAEAATRRVLYNFFTGKYYVCVSGEKNVRFLENLACFVFLLSPFWDSPFCHITDCFCPSNIQGISWQSMECFGLPFLSIDQIAQLTTYTTLKYSWNHPRPHIKYRSNHWRCSIKRGAPKISHNSQKNTCARVSFSIKLQGEACNFIKKETQTQVIPVNFVKFFGKHILQNTSGWLLLQIQNYQIFFQGKHSKSTVISQLQT